MAGRRTVTNDQIQQWIMEAAGQLDELALPEWAQLIAFNSLLNAVQIDDHIYSTSEAVEAIRDAYWIAQTLVYPEPMRARAFAFALSGTSAREVSTKQIHLPGNDKPTLQ